MPDDPCNKRCQHADAVGAEMWADCGRTLCDRYAPTSAEPCAWFLTYPGYDDLGEQCPDEAVEGQPYCAEHGRLADG